jgi:peptidoglycan/LPS O-acetylase OafA/YrhL
LVTPVVHGSNLQGIGVLLLSMLLAYSLSIRNGLLSKLFVWAGKRSYFVYFFHFLVLEALPGGYIASSSFLWEAVDFALVSTSCLTVSLLLSEISWRCFEKPLLSLAKSNSR